MNVETNQTKYEIIDIIYSEMLYVYPSKAEIIKQWIADHINESRKKWMKVQAQPMNLLINFVLRNTMPQ